MNGTHGIPIQFLFANGQIPSKLFKGLFVHFIIGFVKGHLICPFGGGEALEDILGGGGRVSRIGRGQREGEGDFGGELNLSQGQQGSCWRVRKSFTLPCS